MARIGFLSTVVVALTGAALAPATASAAAGPELISVSSAEKGLDAVNHDPSVSDDGQRVAFVRTFGQQESYVYVRDRATGHTRWLDGGFDEYPANVKIALSGNGKTVAVASPDRLEVVDVATGIARSMPGGFTSISAPSISDNGSYVAFTGARSKGGDQNVFRWAVTKGEIEPVTTSGGASHAVISGNAQQIAYAASGHVYRRTVADGERIRVDAGRMGADSNADNGVPRALSDGGLYILFTSSATNLSSDGAACGGGSTGCAYVRRIDDVGGAEVVSRSSAGRPVATSGPATMSGDGRSVAYVAREGLDGAPQAYLHRLAGGTRRVSSDGSGKPANADVRSVSVDDAGRSVAFSTRATNLGSTVGDERVWAGR